METRKCRVCNEEKYLEYFVTRNSRPSGKDTICKQCAADYDYLRKHGTLERQKRDFTKNVESKFQNEIEAKNELLTILGYDLAGELSVYEQFLRKHNLVKDFLD